MARLSRVTPTGIPQHVIQRGNNKQVCFADEEDFACYAHWLKTYSQKFLVEIHAWVFMTNHVHLLCTPKSENSISQMMQSLGRQYVRYFNDKYERTGTLWEGRFKSSLVDAESYLFELYRYIELNPVRADVVKDPANYIWSSYQINALGKSSDLCTPHPLYLQLDSTERSRQKSYRGLFNEILEQSIIDDIQQATRQGMAVGSEKFKQKIEELTGRRLHIRPAGRHKNN